MGPLEGARFAAAVKKAMNILALGLSPHGSIAILGTQVWEYLTTPTPSSHPRNFVYYH